MNFAEAKRLALSGFRALPRKQATYVSKTHSPYDPVTGTSRIDTPHPIEVHQSDVIRSYTGKRRISPAVEGASSVLLFEKPSGFTVQENDEVTIDGDSYIYKILAIAGDGGLDVFVQAYVG